MLSSNKLNWQSLLLLAGMVSAVQPVHGATRQVLVTQSGAQWQMKEAPSTAKDEAATLSVTVHATTAPPTPTFKVKYTGADGKAGEKLLDVAAAPATNTWTTTVSLKDLDLKQDVSVEGTIGGKPVTGPTWHLAQGGASPGPATQSLVLSDLDLKALQWWHDSKRSGEERSKLPKDGQWIIHLPSGTPAGPVPSDLGEPARVGIYVMVAKDERQRPRTDLNLQSCPSVVPFRTTGDVKEFAGVLQGEAIDFFLVPLGPQLKCGAGTLSYNVVVTSRPKNAQAGVDAPEKDASQPEVTTTGVSIRIRPVYHLLVSGFYGFDGAKDPSFSAVNAKIVKQEDSFGLGFGLGMIWAPLGVDYEDMQWYNYFLNPYFAFSTTHPTDNISVGLATTVTGGISFTLGASFHHITTLKGVKEGDPFSGTADVPTQKSWSKEGVGFYIGLALDKNALALVKGIMGK